MWRYAWRETMRHKWRTTGNLLGFVLAVSLMVVLISVVSYSETAAGEVLTTTGTHFIAFMPECADEDCSADLIDPVNEGFTAVGSPSKLLDLNILEDIRSLPTVADAAPALYFKMLDPLTGKSFTIIGLEGFGTTAVNTTSCAATDIVAGRFLIPGDKNMVMLEEAFAYARLLPAGLPIDIGTERFTIAGIINPGIRPAKADIYMRMEDALRIINGRLNTPITSKMNIVLVESAGATEHYRAIDDVARVLGERSLVSSYACSKPAAQVLGINENGLKSITFIVAFAVVAFALKSQYSSVVERRYDIGILKAIGWSDRRIVSQLLGESLIQSAGGGLLGILLGLGIILWLPIEQITGIEASTSIGVSVEALGSGFGLALIGGLTAGFIPGLVAARMRPADILRRL